MDILTGPTLAVVMLGQTHFVDIGREADAVIYYPSPTAAHMTLPGAEPMSGTLTLKDDGYHVAWTGGPAGDWQLAWEPGRIVYIGPDGREAGHVTRIVPGNPEGF